MHIYSNGFMPNDNIFISNHANSGLGKARFKSSSKKKCGVDARFIRAR